MIIWVFDYDFLLLQYFEDDDTIIPAACITVEDAEMLQRFQDQGIRDTIIHLFSLQQKENSL